VANRQIHFHPGDTYRKPGIGGGGSLKVGFSIFQTLRQLQDLFETVFGLFHPVSSTVSDFAFSITDRALHFLFALAHGTLLLGQPGEPWRRYIPLFATNTINYPSTLTHLTQHILAFPDKQNLCPIDSIASSLLPIIATPARIVIFLIGAAIVSGPYKKVLHLLSRGFCARLSMLACN
jgi:hypothetical protein